MEQKVVKFEIGKVLAVIITLAVIAMVAGVALQSNYFQGNIGGEVEDTNPLPARDMDYFSRIDMFKTNIEKGLDYEKELDNLKYDFDLMIKKGYIESGVAEETLKAFSTMNASVAIEFVSKYLPAYQDKVSMLGTNELPAYQDLVVDFAKVSIPAYQNEYLPAYQDKEPEAFAIEIEKVGIEVAKIDAVIEVSKDIPQFLIQRDKDIEIELQNWVDSVKKIESDVSIEFDKDMFAKYIEQGIEIEMLAKTFDAFNAEIEKGIEIEVAIEHFIKGVDSDMPGVFIPQF